MSVVQCFCGRRDYYVLREPSMKELTRLGIDKNKAATLVEGPYPVVLICRRCGRTSRGDGRIADPEGRLSP